MIQMITVLGEGLVPEAWCKGDDDKDDDDPDDRDCQGGRLLPEAPAAETGDRFSRSL